jgi:carbonic anhydrase
MADDIADVIAGIQRFKEAFDADRDYFESIAAGRQAPKMLWIGCADSRVDPGQIIGAQAGDIFVVRNVANVVPPASAGDDSVGAAIEYCLAHLGVDDIVVCGHTGCGGINALGSLLPPAEEHLARWVEYARRSESLVRAARVPAVEHLHEAVKANVLFQQDNLLTYAIVREALAQGRLRLHGWLYDMGTGDLLSYDKSQGNWRPLAEQHR